MIRKEKHNDSDLTLGKIPPQSLDAERYLLGSLMVNNKNIAITTTILKADHFYKDAHRIIFDAIINLYSEGIEVNIFTVKNYIQAKDSLDIVGGAFYLSNLTTDIGSGHGVKEFSVAIIETFIKRELIRIGSECVKSGYDNSINPMIKLFEIQNQALTLYRITESSSTKTQSDILEALISHVSNDGGKNGCKIGLADFDRVTGGFMPGELIVLAGRPGMGKTAFIEAACRGFARSGKKLAVFHLEMTELQFAARLASPIVGIPADTLLKSDLFDKEEVHRRLNIAYSRWNGNPIFDTVYVDDRSSKLHEIVMNSKRLVTDKNIEMIVIDYLQLIGIDNHKGNRESEISQISRRLKLLAKELNVPIVALSQLSRKVEERADRIPQLSDLRESGSIEQDADMVGFFYRPAYYFELTGSVDWATIINRNNTVTSTVDYAEIIIAKNRMGSVGTARLGFIDKFTQFVNAVINEGSMGDPGIVECEPDVL